MHQRQMLLLSRCYFVPPDKMGKAVDDLSKLADH